MESVASLLFWIHLAALAAGGAVSFGMPVVGRQMAAATPDTRPVLFNIAHGLSTVGRAAIGTLIVTGPLILWLRFGWNPPNATWFAVKMILVVLLLAGVIYAGILLKRAEGGDRAAGQMMPRVGGGMLVVFLLLILSAVFAFE